jgi:DNA topoisomerase-2
LFAPNGQFGTRLQGGKDSASERYIFTNLNKICRAIFSEQDDAILKYLDDDGFPVEPLFYAPIIPLVLVNGATGIGTGFSTEILCYNPIEIIGYLKSKLLCEPVGKEFAPYYEGFTGSISTTTPGKYLIKGKYEKVSTDKIRITELPIGLWTDNFKEYLESLTDTTDKAGKKVTPVVKDYDDMSKDTTVDIIITLQKGKLDELEAVKLDNGCNGLEKLFKLFTTASTSNMHLFDAEDKLKKYDTVSEIIDDYYETRLKLYLVRKNHLIDVLQKELILLSNKSKYIQEVLAGTVDLRRKKKDEVTQMLQNKSYAIIGDDEEYKYLTKMPMDSVTEENVTKLNKEFEQKTKELAELEATSPQDMWSKELTRLAEEYSLYKEERERVQSGIYTKKQSVVKKKTKLAINDKI